MKIQNVFREANRVADWLAKTALESGIGFSELKDCWSFSS